MGKFLLISNIIYTTWYMSLIFITSPAKSLDLDKNWMEYSVTPSLPSHLDKATKIAKHLENKSLKELQKVLKVSNKIAKLNFDRLKEWHEDHDIKNSKPALLMYDGAVYKQINKKEFKLNEMNYAQNFVRILSGFYGLLKPYDLIQPYRLEMNNKVDINKSDSLPKYWKEIITDELNKDVKNSKISAVINLASQEYSQVIDTKKLSVPMITIDFKEKKEGKLKTVAIYAKQARGAMLDFVIRNNIKNINDIKKIELSNYHFTAKNKNTITFVRQKIQS